MEQTIAYIRSNVGKIDDKKLQEAVTDLIIFLARNNVVNENSLQKLYVTGFLVGASIPPGKQVVEHIATHLQKGWEATQHPN